MKKKIAIWVLGGAAALGVLGAMGQPERPRCVGVSVVRDERPDRFTVFRAFEDGTVEYWTVDGTPDPWTPTGARPRWMRRAQ